FKQYESIMGLKHLFGYSLLMIGMGLAPLVLVFLGDTHIFNPLFLFSLAICAFTFSFLGIFILKKSR
ncbi:MAG: hypothetical protein ABI416_05120, partial [Ginsengibacter sp.]